MYNILFTVKTNTLIVTDMKNINNTSQIAMECCKTRLFRNTLLAKTSSMPTDQNNKI